MDQTKEAEFLARSEFCKKIRIKKSVNFCFKKRHCKGHDFLSKLFLLPKSSWSSC